MANIDFKYRKGAARDICKYTGTLKAIDSAITKVYNRANALNPNTGFATIYPKQGGHFDMPLKAPNYVKKSGLVGKSGMARGAVIASNYASQKKERESNILLKSLWGR